MLRILSTAATRTIPTCLRPELVRLDEQQIRLQHFTMTMSRKIGTEQQKVT